MARTDEIDRVRLYARRGDARELGSCNFCRDQIDEHGTKNGVVTEVSGVNGHSLKVRFCDGCLGELKRVARR